MTKCQISIGVEKLSIPLTGCIKCGLRICTLQISFKMKGDFLPAALSDNLNQTVDYDLLCQHLECTFSGLGCHQEKSFFAFLMKQIKAFSGLISDIYLETKLLEGPTLSNKFIC